MLTGVDPPLMARWSCSSTLFKYGTGRCRQSSLRSPSPLSCATADGYAAWPSVLITRGAGWFAPPNALARKRLAAAASCLAERRKSRVAPVESTARYRERHLPFTRTYVSSIGQLSLGGF